MPDEVMLANLIQVVLDKSLVMWLSNSVELINNECRDFKIPERDARNRQGKGSLVMYSLLLEPSLHRSDRGVGEVVRCKVAGTQMTVL